MVLTLNKDSTQDSNYLERLAKAKFGVLGQGEIKLLEAAPNGGTAICGPDRDPEAAMNDASTGSTWLAAREIRAELIGWICRDRTALETVDSRGLNIFGARITGKLDLSFVRIRFPLSFANCYFSEPVHLTHTSVTALNFGGSNMEMLTADGITVSYSIYFRHGFVARDRVELRDASIGGSLLCSGGIFENDQGAALLCDRIQVKGSVLMRDNFRAQGEVRFLGAQIGSNLDCAGASFQNPNTALSLENAKVAGSVFLREGFVAQGEVRLLGANIGSTLDCTGGSFGTEGDKALNAETAEIAGNLLMRDGFVANGTVYLHGIQIGGGLDCRGGTFKTLNLNSAVINRIFRWSQVQNKSDIFLDLRNASVGSLEDDEASWPPRGRLSLSGFSYSSLTGAAADADTRLRWVERSEPFRLHPYRQLAKVLDEMGDERGARCVLFRMEKRRREEQEASWWNKPWNSVLQLTIGYGYAPSRALIWLAVLTLAGTLLAGSAYLGGSVVPSDKDAYQEFQVRGEAPPYYSEFNPLIYSVEHSFPFLSLGVKDRWRPQALGQSRIPEVVVNCVMQALQSFICSGLTTQWYFGGGCGDRCWPVGFLRHCSWLVSQG